MDIFNEKIIKRRKNSIDFVLFFFIIAFTIAAAVLLYLYAKIFFVLITPAFIFLAYYLISLRNIEYEYAVTNGDLDIDIIINQKKRKSLFNANCKEFEVVATLDSTKYTKEIKSCKNINDFSSGDKQAQVWFIYMRKDQKNTVILFEPSSKMIDNFAMYIPKKVHR